MSYGRTVAKNAAWLIAATALNKVVAFVTFALVARLTGAQITGTYFYGVSVTSVFVILADLGMTPVVIRAIAAGRDDASKLTAAAFRAKSFLAPVAILCALGYGVATHADAVTMATIAIACLVMTADTVHLTLYGTLRGRQDLKPESIGMLVGQLLTALGSISAAVFGLGAPGLAAGLLMGSLWNVGWSWSQTRAMGIRFISPSRTDLRMLAREAVPFAIAGIAVKLYSYVDSLLIHAYHGAAAVGLYAVAYKMTYALQFLPLTFTAALYPALAAAWSRKEHTQLKQTFTGSLRLMAAVGFPLSAGLSALAPRIIPLVYGNAFLGAVAPFEILPWVLLPIFMDFPVGSLLNATHRAHLKTTAMVGTVLINVVLNAVLVPSMGPVGAAWAGVFSFWALFFFGVGFSYKDAGGVGAYASIIGRSLIAAGISWFAWRTIGMHIPFLAAGIFGAAIAILVAFLLRLLTLDDVRFVLAFRRRPSTAETDIHAED